MQSFGLTRPAHVAARKTPPSYDEDGRVAVHRGQRAGIGGYGVALDRDAPPDQEGTMHTNRGEENGAR